MKLNSEFNQTELLGATYTQMKRYKSQNWGANFLFGLLLIVSVFAQPLIGQSYNMTVKTSDISGAGTDANLSIKLIGQQGETNYISLNSKISGDAFERGALDRAHLGQSGVLGHIIGIRIKSDGKYAGAGWKFDWLQVNDGKIWYTFKYNEFIEGGSVFVPLSRAVEKTTQKEIQIKDRFAPTKTYHMTVQTSNLSGAGTDSNIEVMLYGRNGTTTYIPLNDKVSGNAFEQGQLDRISPLTTVSDIGEIYKIALRHNGAYSGSEWKFSWLQINDGKTWYTFNYENDDGHPYGIDDETIHLRVVRITRK